MPLGHDDRQPTDVLELAHGGGVDLPRTHAVDVRCAGQEGLSFVRADEEVEPPAMPTLELRVLDEVSHHLVFAMPEAAKIRASRLGGGDEGWRVWCW